MQGVPEVPPLSLRSLLRGSTCALLLAPLSLRAEPDASAALDIPAGPQVPRAAVPESDGRTRGNVTLRPFFRSDELRFTIDGGGIDIISELDWDDVRSAGLEVESRVRV